MTSPETASGPSPVAKPCPICGKPASAADHPFCSPRCADIDLHRWLRGVYAVPATETNADEDDDTMRGETE